MLYISMNVVRAGTLGQIARMYCTYPDHLLLPPGFGHCLIQTIVKICFLNVFFVSKSLKEEKMQENCQTI